MANHQKMSPKGLTNIYLQNNFLRRTYLHMKLLKTISQHLPLTTSQHTHQQSTFIIITHATTTIPQQQT